MDLRKLLRCILTVLLAISLSPTALGASSLSLSAVFLGEPDVFVPGVALGTEISITRSLGLFAGGAYFLSGTWDLALGVSWHATPRFALQMQALLLFDVIDGFVPQLGAGMRFSFPLSRSFAFFNELGLNMPLVSRFLQPKYTVGLSLLFEPP
jgi:hypothetical protein